jgi:hypothetical protein
MPNPVVITIVRKPNGHIQPEEGGSTTGIRTKVPSGTPIQFRPGGGATSVVVTFDNDSPFGDNQQDKQNLNAGTVRKPFNAAEPGKNVYAYRCVLTIGGQQISWPPPGQPGEQGGEMEITL